MNNKWYLFFFLLLAVLAGFYIYNKYQNAPSIQFEQLSFSTLNNETFSINSLKGKKVIVCFSASWCGNCIDELNQLSKIKTSELSDVEVMVVSDESIEEIEILKNRNQYPFTFIKLNQTFESIGINAIPTTYLLNGELEIKKQKVGYLDWSDPSTLQHLKTLMN